MEITKHISLLPSGYPAVLPFVFSLLLPSWRRFAAPRHSRCFPTGLFPKTPLTFSVLTRGGVAHCRQTSYLGERKNQQDPSHRGPFGSWPPFNRGDRRREQDHGRDMVERQRGDR
ncbi:hypothetical protein CCUS01_10947 [Colletotrichum cuscutae]|uniref:Uncharacterized protein n=1 Tax=Colletotrichum cuscutae TaxID=1209917 RepID=A0AAI9U8B6_9PEZI|nr:hypothetical protein CCUS01_10947 [Colletotrichum cuscutae]